MTSQGIEPRTTRNCTRSFNHWATRLLWVSESCQTLTIQQKPPETDVNKEFTEEAPTHPDDSEDKNPNGDEIEEEYVIQHNKDEEDDCDVDNEVLLEKIMNEVYTGELNLFSSIITLCKYSIL